MIDQYGSSNVFLFFLKNLVKLECAKRALCSLGVSIEGAGTKQPILHQNGQCLKKPIIHIFFGLFAAWCKKDNSGVCIRD